MHQLALQEQHIAFMLVYGRLKKQQRRQAKYPNKNAKEVQIQVGHPVFYRKHAHYGKLDIKWEPFYRVIEQTSPVTFVIKNQLNGKTIKAHAGHLKLTKIHDWEIPLTVTGKPQQKANFVVAPKSDDSEETEGSSESEPENPIDKVVPKYHRERVHSDEEDNIPPMELRKRIRNCERRECEETSPISDNDCVFSDVDSMETVDNDWSDYMNVDALTKKKRSVAQVRQRKVNTLVNALVDMF